MNTIISSSEMAGLKAGYKEYKRNSKENYF